MSHYLPLEITREENLWMARSSVVPGLLVTGDSIDQLLIELPHVAQALYDVSQEKGWSFVRDVPDLHLADIVWVFELPHPLLQAA